MFSKKEDFTNTIQYKIGLRFDDLHAESYNSINDLADIFINKDAKAKWKSLNFLNLYYQAKAFLEKETNQTINSNTNLNDLLSKNQKQAFISFLNQNQIKPIEFLRPDGMNNLLAWFPVFGILAPMLVSTYLVTKLDITGWVYLSGLVGVGIWLILINLTKPLKTKFNPPTFLDYIKSTYVIRYKTLSQTDINPELVKQFINDELQLVYNKSFLFEENIPAD